MERLLVAIREFWWVVTIVAGLAGTVIGGVTAGLARYNFYYLAEAKSVDTLRGLQQTTANLDTHITNLETRLTDLSQRSDRVTWAGEQNAAAFNQVVSEHREVHRQIDEMKDALADIKGQLKSNNDRILLILDPKFKLRP